MSKRPSDENVWGSGSFGGKIEVFRAGRSSSSRWRRGRQCGELAKLILGERTVDMALKDNTTIVTSKPCNRLVDPTLLKYSALHIRAKKLQLPISTKQLALCTSRNK